MPEKRLRRARLAHLLAFAFIPVGATAILRVFGDVTLPVLALVVIPYLASGYWLATAKCPKCNEYFFWSFERGSNPVAHRCLRCRHEI